MPRTDAASFDLSSTPADVARDTAVVDRTAAVRSATRDVPPAKWQCRTVRGLGAADALLDRLTAAECELLVLAPSVYVVRWR